MSLFVVPWTALYAEFSDDIGKPSPTWRYAVGLTGMLVFTLATWRLIFASTPAFTPGQLNPAAYARFAPVAAITVSAAVLITTHFTRREIPYLLQPVNAPPRLGPGRVWRDISSTFANRDFLVLFFGALTFAGISGTTDTLGTYVQTYFWGLAPEQLQWFSLSVLGAVLAFAVSGNNRAVVRSKEPTPGQLRGFDGRWHGGGGPAPGASVAAQRRAAAAGYPGRQ